MREFFGFGGYQREPSGAYSFGHLFQVTIILVILLGLAVFFGIKNKNKDEKTKNIPIIVAAIAIDALEIFKIFIVCIRAHDASLILLNLPLFLCSLQLITLPVAAFTKGRIREACLDFIFMFGILGGLAGTYGAAQLYGSYPVFCFDNVVSAITHSISAFASIYIGVVGLASMKKKNIFITFSLLIGLCILAYIADVLIPYNYMFLMNHDGTPYQIFYNLVNGNKVLYPMIVVILFLLYILVFYGVIFLIRRKKAKE